LRKGNVIDIKREGRSKPWNVSMTNITNVKDAGDAKVLVLGNSTLINMDAQTSELRIQLS